jgi:hypothetical protein
VVTHYGVIDGIALDYYAYKMCGVCRSRMAYHTRDLCGREAYGGFADLANALNARYTNLEAQWNQVNACKHARAISFQQHELRGRNDPAHGHIVNMLEAMSNAINTYHTARTSVVYYLGGNYLGRGHSFLIDFTFADGTHYYIYCDSTGASQRDVDFYETARLSGHMRYGGKRSKKSRKAKSRKAKSRKAKSRKARKTRRN